MQSVGRDTLVDGRYRIVKRIGSGGMADVFCAEDQQLGRRIALKLLHRRFAADPQFVERFRREASAAAGLQHPSIVGIFDRGEWDGTYYIAMEFVEGRTLKDVILDRGPAPPEAAADIAVQILRAARFAHRHGVVHRDIKPQNILVDDEGRVRVTDFGIARAGTSDMTETGSVMGTAQYLSPEQAQGRPVDARADLYAVGVVLYELLTGRVPFDGDSPVTVALKHVSEPPRPPRDVSPSVPAPLEEIVLRAMEKDPERRFQDADAFIAALEGARTGVHALPPLPPVREVVVEEEEPRRRRWPWVVAALAVLAILAGLFLTLRPEELRVPDVVGQREAVAAQALRNRGFEVEIVAVTNEAVDRDTVAAQDPLPDTQAPEGSTVTITVSTGPGEAPVPAVQGLEREEAAAALREAGFRVDTERAFDASVPRGRVIDSQPPAGTTIERGTSVLLRLSRGAEPVEVPDVTGETEDDARSALESAGLGVQEESETSEEAEPGTVLAQDPEGGTEVDPGSSVTITVTEPPPATEIPDLIGLPRADAEGRLTAAGFDVRVREEAVTAENEDGVVVDQSPSGGEEREEGTRVTLVVGAFEPEPEPTPTPTPTPTATPEPEATVAPAEEEG